MVEPVHATTEPPPSQGRPPQGPAKPVAPVRLDPSLRHRPLPYLIDRPVTALAMRTVVGCFGRQMRSIEGLEHVQAARDPFILALNHNQRPEAVLVPAWLGLLRGGRMIHFLIDWNFMLIPGLAALMRLNDPIVVVRKDARPRFLNVFKRHFLGPLPSHEEARVRLRQGCSVGLFPEGTINRDPERLLRGLSGAARLSLETGVPVVPVGIRFPNRPGNRRISDLDTMTLHVGEPLVPPGPSGPEPSGREVAAWHAAVMTALARLSGKSWSPRNPRTKNETE